MRLSRLHGLQHTEVRARSRARIGALPSGARVRPTASGDHRATAAQPSNLVSRASGFGDRIRPGDVREASQLGAAEGKAAHRLVAARLPCVDLAGGKPASALPFVLDPLARGGDRVPLARCCHAVRLPRRRPSMRTSGSAAEVMRFIASATQRRCLDGRMCTAAGGPVAEAAPRLDALTVAIDARPGAAPTWPPRCTVPPLTSAGRNASHGARAR